MENLNEYKNCEAIQKFLTDNRKELYEIAMLKEMRNIINYEKYGRMVIREINKLKKEMISNEQIVKEIFFSININNYDLEKDIFKSILENKAQSILEIKTTELTWELSQWKYQQEKEHH